MEQFKCHGRERDGKDKLMKKIFSLRRHKKKPSRQGEGFQTIKAIKALIDEREKVRCPGEVPNHLAGPPVFSTIFVAITFPSIELTHTLT
jgi:hypothetical protein